jgi:catechol 2,3-dioxygenase-like lactoylglutathione lyase family enzyme
MLSTAEMMCFAATKNAEAAKDFYQNTLGLTLVEDSPFALAFDANGTMLRIQKVAEHTARSIRVWTGRGESTSELFKCRH